MKNEKDNISQFDELFKSSLENHSVQAPAGVFEAVSAAGAASGATVKVLVGKWIVGSLAAIGVATSVYYAVESKNDVDITTPTSNATGQSITQQEIEVLPSDNTTSAEESNYSNVEADVNQTPANTLRNDDAKASIIKSEKKDVKETPTAYALESKLEEDFKKPEVASLGGNTKTIPDQTSIRIKGSICYGNTFEMFISTKGQTDWFVNDIKLANSGSSVPYQFMEKKGFRIAAYQNGQKVADTFIDLKAKKVKLSIVDMGSGVEQISASAIGTWYYDNAMLSTYPQFTYNSILYPQKPYFISKDKNGCLDTSKVISTKEKGYFNIPQTAFTPNGDGKNDVYEVEIRGYTDFSILITDINKKVVFSTTNPEIKWDGTYQSNGLPCDEGTYFAIVSYKLNGTNIKKVKYEKVYLTK